MSAEPEAPAIPRRFTVGDEIRSLMRTDDDPNDLSTGQDLGPVGENGEPFCKTCHDADHKKTPATHVCLRGDASGPSWAFYCGEHKRSPKVEYEGWPVFELKAPAAPAPEPFKMVFHGVCLAACVEGGPLDGHHLQIEVASSEYPWRKHLTEGSHSGRPAVWSFPLHRPFRLNKVEEASKYVFAGPDLREGGRFVGKPLRFTVEVDPEAKY